MNMRDLWDAIKVPLAIICIIGLFALVGYASVMEGRACREAGGEMVYSHTTYALINGTMYPMHHYECSVEVK